MDRLLVMRSFVSVADVGSFSGAAKLLGTSGSQISRHVADLEDQIGARLVNRTARSVSLTEAGVRYSEFARRILGQIQEEDQALSLMRERPEGQLSVICPKWIGSLDLGEAIADFSVAHPRITLRFELCTMSDRTPHDFLASGFDVAFHTRDVRDSSVRLQRITSLPFVLCAAPEYLRAHGPVEHPQDLSDHDCLLHSNDPVWRLGDEPSGHRVQRVAFLSNSYIALEKAAVHGRGVALLPHRSAHEHLAAGRLERLLPDVRMPERALYAIHGPDPRMPRKVTVLLAFLRSWFTEHPLPVLDPPAAIRSGA